MLLRCRLIHPVGECIYSCLEYCNDRCIRLILCPSCMYTVCTHRWHMYCLSLDVLIEYALPAFALLHPLVLTFVQYTANNCQLPTPINIPVLMYIISTRVHLQYLSTLVSCLNRVMSNRTRVAFSASHVCHINQYRLSVSINCITALHLTNLVKP